MSRSISNSDDLIDGRDIVARVEELEAELETAREKEREEADEDEREQIPEPFEDWLTWVLDSEDGHLMTAEAEELKVLRALVEEVNANAGDSCDDGAGLIRDSYFEDYARELHDDINGRDKVSGWPYDFIDWERAADALKVDYSSIDFDGVEYWVRA